jgi:hypothetical protein
MSKHDATSTPLIVTDDEVMSLAALTGRAWWTGLRSVDTDDEKDMLRASARGLRSMAVRGLVSEEGEPVAELSLVTACLGVTPSATVAAVDEHDRVLEDAPLLVLFRTGPAFFVACRSDVSGTHVLHEVDLDDGVDLVAEQLRTGSDVPVAAAFWDEAGRPQGGLRRRGGGCWTLGPGGTELTALDVADDPAAFAEAVASFWGIPA